MLQASSAPHSEPPSSEALDQLQAQLAPYMRGKPEVIRLVLCALLSGGHVLLEDVPGVGKTTLVRALAASLGLDFQRVQCTSDLMPADLLGITVYDRDRGAFQFKQGPVFTELLLVDEINRASPRTQSALLEAMAERQVTVDGTRHELPELFTVVATQNPLDVHGTFALPESQLDRFLFRTSLGYPAPDVERQLLQEAAGRPSVRSLAQVLAPETLKALRASVREVHVDPSLIDYLHAIVLATREPAHFRLGASTRAALSLLQAIRAHAWLQGSAFARPQDVTALIVPALAHRVALRDEVESDLDSQEAALRALLDRIPVPI